MDRYSDAVTVLREALRIKPDFAEAHNELGYSYLKMQQYPAAVASLRQATRLKPDYALAHLNLGLTYVSMGNKNAAMEEYRTLKSLDQKKAATLLTEINK
jgi:Flp pilus assembly protein TadD